MVEDQLERGLRILEETRPSRQSDIDRMTETYRGKRPGWLRVMRANVRITPGRLLLYEPSPRAVAHDKDAPGGVGLKMGQHCKVVNARTREAGLREEQPIFELFVRFSDGAEYWVPVDDFCFDKLDAAAIP